MLTIKTTPICENVQKGSFFGFFENTFQALLKSAIIENNLYSKRAQLLRSQSYLSHKLGLYLLGAISPF